MRYGDGGWYTSERGRAAKGGSEQEGQKQTRDGQVVNRGSSKRPTCVEWTGGIDPGETHRQAMADHKGRGWTLMRSYLSNEQDHPLIPGNKPLRLTHPPEIHPLPLLPNPSPTYRTASRLLGLDSSYPPPQTSTSGWKPVLDVSSTTGQVFLVLDPRRSSPSKRDGGTGRRDWLVLMRFEQSAERCIERGSQQVSKAR